jgi:hypothetical protein
LHLLVKLLAIGGFMPDNNTPQYYRYKRNPEAERWYLSNVIGSLPAGFRDAFRYEAESGNSPRRAVENLVNRYQGNLPVDMKPDELEKIIMDYNHIRELQQRDREAEMEYRKARKELMSQWGERRPIEEIPDEQTNRIILRVKGTNYERGVPLPPKEVTYSYEEMPYYLQRYNQYRSEEEAKKAAKNPVTMLDERSIQEIRKRQQNTITPSVMGNIMGYMNRG